MADEDENERIVTLVGEDEADPARGRISWGSPIGHAIRGAGVEDIRRVLLPSGEREYEVMAILYPDAASKEKINLPGESEPHSPMRP